MEINIRRLSSTWSKPNLPASSWNCSPSPDTYHLSLAPQARHPSARGLYNPIPFLRIPVSPVTESWPFSWHKSLTSTSSSPFPWPALCSGLPISSHPNIYNSPVVASRPALSLFSLWTNGTPREPRTVKKEASSEFLPVVNTVHNWDCADWDCAAGSWRAGQTASSFPKCLQRRTQSSQVFREINGEKSSLKTSAFPVCGKLEPLTLAFYQ